MSMNLSPRVGVDAKLDTGLSINSDDIIRLYKNNLAEARDPVNIKNLRDVAVGQAENEKYLVKNTNVCDIDEMDKMRDHIGELNTNGMKHYMTNQFYSSSAMNAIMCSIDSVLFTSPFDAGSLHFNDRIRLFIHNLHQIGSNSVEGYALLGDFENTKDMFVIKVSRIPPMIVYYMN